MITEHGVHEVTVLAVDGGQVGTLRHDPDWYGSETAYYTERRIPASAVGRTLATYDREDFD
jgi:hypothetical protein